MRQLTAQIEDLDFLNRLQITREQAARLVPLLRAGEGSRQAAQQQEERAAAALAAALREKRGFLVKDQQVPAALAARVAQLTEETRKAGVPDPAAEKTLVEGLRAVLSADQLSIAAGGLEARMQATEMLDGYRKLPPDDFEREIRPFVEDLASGSGVMSADQLEALFREARALPAEEYKQSRDKLVRQLAPLFAPAGEAQDQMVARAFTRPQLVTLLAEKAQAGE